MIWIGITFLALACGSIVGGALLMGAEIIDEWDSNATLQTNSREALITVGKAAGVIFAVVGGAIFCLLMIVLAVAGLWNAAATFLA